QTAGLAFLDRASNPKNGTTDPRILAAALRRGATLYIGQRYTPLDLQGLRSLLKDTFPFDDDYRHHQLIGPTAICAHWFWFIGRRCGLNHLYPATFLRQLIVTCFGLDYPDVPMDAVLAGLIERGFQVERVKAGATSFNWAANIRTLTYLPGRDRHWVRLNALGIRDAIPPIRISD